MESLIAELTGRFSEWQSRQADPGASSMRGRAAGARSSLSGAPVFDPRVISEELVRQAVMNGLAIKRASLHRKPVSEGNTAQVVERLALSLPFVFKLQDDEKLVDEARVIQLIKGDRKLPERFRNAFPTVYALKSDSAPYAYLMEEFSRADGYQSLAQILFESPLCPEALEAESRRLISGVLEILFEAYDASLNHNKIPNVDQVYLGRIEERLQAAADIDSVFRPSAMRVNGYDYAPWDSYVTQIRNREVQLRGLPPKFTCVVHGDANPENILLAYRTNRVDCRFIDPKDWGDGDYLFDIVKLAHYLDVTGPMERNPHNQLQVAQSRKGGRLELRYTLSLRDQMHAAFELVKIRAQQFAEAHDDLAGMRLRFDLGMASNLLGLVPGRLSKNRDAALVFYGEGMKWLHAFTQQIDSPQVRRTTAR